MFARDGEVGPGSEDGGRATDMGSGSCAATSSGGGKDVSAGDGEVGPGWEGGGVMDIGTGSWAPPLSEDRKDFSVAGGEVEVPDIRDSGPEAEDNE